jgi:hypothetical protein
MARREGDSIVVQQPINSVKNTRRFAKDVRSVERNVHGNVFSNQGGRLRPDELVGVRLYDEGEKVIVVEARQLLEFARASDRAVYVNIVATALSAGSGAVAGNVASSVAARSFATRLAVNTVTGAGLGFATGAGSSAIVDAGYVYSGDISGGQLLSNAWESGKSGAKYGAAFGAAGTVLQAGVSRLSPNAKLQAPAEATTRLDKPSTPPVEVRTSKTPDYGKPEASGSPRVTTTRPMRKLPGGAPRGTMGGSEGDPVAYRRSAPSVEVRRQGTPDLGKPEYSVGPQTPGPDPWAAPPQPAKPATPRAPRGHHQATGQAAQEAGAQGLVDLQKGRVGMQEHRTAPAVRKATGQVGQGVDSTHIVAQAVYRAVGADPNLAPTVNMGRAINNAIDSAWVPKWNRAQNLGKRVTGADYRNWVLEGIRNVPENLLSKPAKGTLEWALDLELRGLGITADTVLLPGVP